MIQRFIKTCKTILSRSGDDFNCGDIRCGDCPASARYNNCGSCDSTKGGLFEDSSDHQAIRRYFENKLKELEGGSMTIQEQIDKIAAEAKAKIDELVKLQKSEEWKPVKGEWCVFWCESWDSRIVRMFDKMENNKYVDSIGLYWDNCRKLKPEDVGFTQLKPSWDDAPEWADWLAMDSDGSWWWYVNKPNIIQGQWSKPSGRKGIAVLKNWESSLEERPKNG